MTSIEWHGVAEFDAALDRTIVEATGEGTEIAMRGAELVAELARSKAPVDTGDLHGHIQARPNGPGRAVAEATSGHAGYVEHGTRNMRAEPFMEPAQREAAPAIEAAAVERWRHATS